MKRFDCVACFLFAVLLIFSTLRSAERRENPELDEKVNAFLNSDVRWREMNVPAIDGQLLHDLI
ncbi:hypothetical protein EH222_13480, partial [candidate division KSB1 bacterium]